jgi:cytochrome c biogenesis protein CcdA
MTMSSLILAFLAGILSTLSPCALPLLPIVLGAAVSAHRLGAVALVAGLCISFVAIGILLATIGFSVGVNEGVTRGLGAVPLAAIGVVLLVPMLQDRISTWASPAGKLLNGAPIGSGWRGQLTLGLLLGAVWTPCVGPTLGAASMMAAKGEDLWQVGLVMSTFGVGAALPLLAIGLASREAALRWRGRLLAGGMAGRKILGIALVAVGILVFTGLDKRAESWLVANSPAWLTELTTRY